MVRNARVTMTEVSLTELERELLELCSIAPNMGETTTTLDEAMLELSPGRRAVETALRGLVDRALMTTARGTFGGMHRFRDGREEHRIYEDDWWVLTPAGRAAIGLGPPGGIQQM